MNSFWEWMKTRLGIEELWNALFARHVPEAKGWTAWLYTLGSASLFVFTVQAITGALLAMNYVPSPDHAYDSIRFINEQVLLGRFLRGLHHWGATAMVILVSLHMLRVYFMGSYKYPREATWIVGVLIFLVVMGFSFTGYLLPWDQKAYWATMVGVNISAQVPVIGEYIGKVLKGGDEMGAVTLTRFYAIQVLVLPAIILGALAIHLFLVVWHGISESPTRKEDDQNKNAGTGILQ
ncbi:MAG: cytochrome b N-terminal domain-containing protein [Elusimicrobia bacterium]|nr:cytochrome b N-terminal domain-containing protein [Elusimicrobiota bacterium]